MKNNICRFIPSSGSGDTINTVNFVYETKADRFGEPKTDMLYKVHLVVNGKGRFVSSNKTHTIKKGDLFFTFPSCPYSVFSDGELEYVYISFLGLRANKIMNSLKIDRINCVLFGYEELAETLTAYILKSTPCNAGMISESALLYIFSVIAARLDADEDETQNDTAHKIKKYIDANYGDFDLTPTSIAKLFSYNKNYIAGLFKKQIGMTVVQYITSIRIQNACALFGGNITGVKDIAYLCGFNDPLYFSRVFKKYTGQSPKDFVKNIKDPNAN